jgi:hypothetical protein
MLDVRREMRDSSGMSRGGCLQEISLESTDCFCLWCVLCVT